MIIKITKTEKIELLKALKEGFIDTSKVPALQEVLDSERPDLKMRYLTDEALHNLIVDLQNKLNKSNT